MLDAIKGIFRITSLGVSLVIGFFRDIVSLITLLLGLSSKISYYTNTFLPPALTAVFAVLIVAVILYKILGREG